MIRVLSTLAVLLGAVPGSASHPAPRPVRSQDSRGREGHGLREAMGVAEVETGGEAVSARRIAMGGTVSTDGKGGFEVLVHMPRQAEGWRCFIDGNNMKLRRKERIPNPASKVR